MPDPVIDQSIDIHGDAVLDALPVAIVMTDADGRIIRWSTPAEQLYGWAADEVIGRTVYEVLTPGDDPAPGRALVGRVLGGDSVETDFTVYRRDGRSVDVWVSSHPIFDDEGNVIAIVGASQDVTDLRAAQRSNAELTERLQLALDAGGLGIWQLDLASRTIHVDHQVERIVGLATGVGPNDFDAWTEIIHPDDRPAAIEAVEAAVLGQDSFTVEHRIVQPDGTVRWLRSTGCATFNEDGDVTGAIACAVDATTAVLLTQDRERLVAEAIEAADRERTNRERIELLGRVNDALVGADDRQAVMASVASAAVPELGDWCAVYVFPSESADVPDFEVAHADPDMRRYAYDLRGHHPYDPDASVGAPAVIRRGEPEFYPDLTDEQLNSPVAAEYQRRILRDLGMRSIIGVPLIKHGRVLGALQFVMTSERRRYSEDDLALAQAVAARVASKLDNIGLSESRREISETLQASLLPDELPDVPGVDIAVCYDAAGEAVEVGGDFYDVFALDHNTWGVAIGDVCGTGPRAASVTGLARHTVASAAWLGLRPEAVLRHLNETLLRRDTGTFLTLAYAALRTDSDGGGVDLDIAVGGHPLPIVVRADGTTGTIGTAGTLLGVFDDLRVEAARVELAPGDLVLFYTDGVTDVSPPYDLTTEELTELVARAAAGGASAKDTSQGISDDLAAILPLDQRNDDIALLALRVT